MNPFDYYNPTLLMYGENKEATVGKLIADMEVKKILLHYGGGSIKKTGVYDTVCRSLKEAGVDFIELGGVCPNPHLALVREGIDLCRKEQVELVLAVGGGSVIDSAKAIALGATNDQDVWEIFQRKLKVNSALKVATILTIPAAGSESSANTVITDEANHDKIGYGNSVLYPVFSIINPRLFMTLSPLQMAHGISDMLSHIMERYFTPTLNTDLTDALCEGVMRTIIENARRLMANPQDYIPYEQLGICGTIAHNGILGLGREEAWACHAIGHELSGKYDLAHGASLSIITPAWMEYTRNENKAIFAQFAISVFGISANLRDVDRIVSKGIAALRRFYLEMGLPISMNDAGAKEQDYELMSRKCTREGTEFVRTLGGAKKLNHKDVLNIYYLATIKEV